MRDDEERDDEEEEEDVNTLELDQITQKEAYDRGMDAVVQGIYESLSPEQFSAFQSNIKVGRDASKKKAPLSETERRNQKLTEDNVNQEEEELAPARPLTDIDRELDRLNRGEIGVEDLSEPADRKLAG